MKTQFAVLGAGMQGTAAAYDLARFAHAESVLLADMHLSQAQKAADRVNMLLGRKTCHATSVNALDPASLGRMLESVDVMLSCVPYWMHPLIAKTAIATKTNMLDLGGDTEETMKTLALHDDAIAAGISLVPDCGLAPGLVNNIGMYLVGEFEQPETVKMYCGVLPQNPKPPFNYKLTFNVEGLVAEYEDEAVALRNGEVILIETLAELEDLHIEQLGPMEAFTTSGGTSTAPYTLQGKIPNYEYKTIRHPGHCEKMRIFKDFGFWGKDPVEAAGVSIRPRDLFFKVFGEKLAAYKDLDLCAIRGVGIGTRKGERMRLQVDIFDKQCEVTGFTSMERLTGFSLAIVAAQVAAGNVAKGGIRYETAMPSKLFLDEIQKRGVSIKFSEERA
ncbi:MAG: saccharopine dehydrogenase family protein [Fimbriimonas sp.]